MAWQVVEVKKPLASVGRMCDAGNVAAFARDGGYAAPGEYMEEVIGMLEKMDQSTLRMKKGEWGCTTSTFGCISPRRTY